MGPRVNGSNGSTRQRVSFTFTILYMIADDARLTPPRCKKHTAYDDTRLTPHHCKKHTASFARSTGKFPSYINSNKSTFGSLFCIFCCFSLFYLIHVSSFTIPMCIISSILCYSFPSPSAPSDSIQLIVLLHST